MSTTMHHLGGRGLLLQCVALTALLLHVPPASPQEATEASTQPYDHGLELYVSEEALQGLYQRPMDLGDLGETRASLGFFFNEDRDLVGMLDLLATIQIPARSPWTVQAGPRVYGALMNVEETDLFAVGLGGELKYALTPDRRTNLSLGGFYGPSILTFGEADNMYDIHLRFETRLIEGVQVFVGYRLFEWDMTIGPTDDPLAAQARKIDDGIQLGLRATF